MAKYKETEEGQGLFLSINLNEQLVIGTFEHNLKRLIDKKMDLSIFDKKYKNDLTGASAIEPGILIREEQRMSVKNSSPAVTPAVPAPHMLRNNLARINSCCAIFRTKKKTAPLFSLKPNLFFPKLKYLKSLYPVNLKTSTVFINEFAV